MPGKRIINPSLIITDWESAINNNAKILTDWNGLLEARPIYLKYLGNAWFQGSETGAIYRNQILPTDKYIRVSVDGGVTWKILNVDNLDNLHPPVTIAEGSEDYLAIDEFQVLSFTPPAVHNPVTIATGSEANLSVDENQVLTFTPQTVHSPVTIAVGSEGMGSIDENQVLTLTPIETHPPVSIHADTQDVATITVEEQILHLEKILATFLHLSDVPVNYTGAGGQVVRVKATEDGLEFGDINVSDVNGIIEDIAWDFNDVTAGIAQSYTLDIKASFAYTILSACLETDIGTLTGVEVRINNTPVTSLTSLTVDTAVDETVATAANNVVTGDRVWIVTSTGYTGLPTVLRGKLKIQRV